MINLDIAPNLFEPNCLLEKALNIYFKSKFKKAKKQFQLVLKTKKNDAPSKIFIERCKEYIKNPPKKPWDGSYEMKTK